MLDTRKRKDSKLKLLIILLVITAFTLVGYQENKTERQETIEKYKARYFPNDMKIYPGHRGNTTYQEMMKTNVDLQ